MPAPNSYNMTLNRLRTVSLGSAGSIQAASCFVEAHVTTKIIACPKVNFTFMLAMRSPFRSMFVTFAFYPLTLAHQLLNIISSGQL